MENDSNGHIHPLNRAIKDVSSIFAKIGFSVAVGPELETEFYNFDSLNSSDVRAKIEAMKKAP